MATPNKDRIISKKEVVKHSSAIQASNNVSLLQRRSWNALLAHAYDDLPQQEVYEVSIRALCAVLGFSSNNREYLKNHLRALQTATVEWNLLGKDQQNEWHSYSLLADVKIKGDILRYSYGPMLRELLYSPTMYAKISLSLQNKFTSKYSLALYELALDYFDAKRGVGETPWLSVEEFRKLMGVAAHELTLFKFFNRDVIKKATTEINSKTDLRVRPELSKKKRQVVSLKFHVTMKTKFVPVQVLTSPQIAAKSQNGSVPQKAERQATAPNFKPSDSPSEGDQPLVNQLVAREVSNTVAAGLVGKYPANLIQRRIELHDHQLQNGHSHIPARLITQKGNAPARLVASIRGGEDWQEDGDFKSTADSKQEQEVAAAKLRHEKAGRTALLKEYVVAIRPHIKTADLALSKSIKVQAELFYDVFHEPFFETVHGKKPPASYKTKRIDEYLKKPASKDQWVYHLGGKNLRANTEAKAKEQGTEVTASDFDLAETHFQ